MARKRHVLHQKLPVLVLAIDASFDPITQACRKVRESRSYPRLRRQGYQITTLAGPLARRLYVSSELHRANMIYITAMGHGDERSFTGDFFDPILQIGSYTVDEARGKIFHLLSCRTAAQLGPDLVRNGCRAFFGYDENFTFVPGKIEAFLDCDAEVDCAILSGHSASEVYQATRGAFERQVAEFRKSGQYYTAAVLEFDLDHLRSPVDGSAWGDPRAVLVQP